MGWFKKATGISWTQVRKPVIYGGIMAAALYTGGAAAGAMGVNGVSGASVLGSATGATAVGSATLQGYNAGEQEISNKKAQAEYQRQIDEANAKALQERKENLEKLRKKYGNYNTNNSFKNQTGAVQNDIILG